MPLSFHIARRYILARKGQAFISFISLTSLLGVALGVTVLLTVLSVMNGFQQEISQRILSMTPHIVASSSQGLLHDADDWAGDFAARSDILGATPVIDGQGMVTRGSRLQGVLVRGIDPEKVDAIYPLRQRMIVGDLTDLAKSRYGVVLGLPLAQQFGVGIGDPVTLIIPEANVSLAGITPRLRQLTVVGLYESGYAYDQSHIFMRLEDAAKLYRTDEAVSGIQLRIDDPFQAPHLAQRLSEDYGFGFHFEPWTLRHAHYFEAVKMEKAMMFLILVLIIAVAAFNLVSSLVMMVSDKRGDIAILQAMGAGRRFLMAVFMWQGLIVGFAGTCFGAIGGYYLSHHVTEAVRLLESFLGRELISSDVYFIDYLPSHFLWSDALQVIAVAFGLCFVATWYPAWRASRIDPAKVLRHG